MKLAIAYEKGMVFQHFGKCPYFLIVQIIDHNVISRSLLNAEGSGHGALVTLLHEQGVELLICGGIGSGARNALETAGISLISGAKGNADLALDAYIAGELQDDPRGQCNHHHDEGAHTCGSHEDCHV